MNTANHPENKQLTPLTLPWGVKGKLKGGSQMEDQTKQYGVLLKDQIKTLIEREKMIEDPDPEYLDPQTDNLQPASYNMLLGSEYYYYKEGKPSFLSDSKPTLCIPSHDLVFVSSYETFKLPANVVARYDLRMEFLYQGLILQTGTHIDPGYKGKIFSLLFNLSDKSVELNYGKPFATMEFSYTTPQPDPPRFVYDGPRQSMKFLEQVLPGGRELKSGLRELAEEMAETKGSVESANERMNSRMAENEKRVDEGRREMQNVNMIFLMVVGVVLTAIAAILVPESIGRVMQHPVDLRVVITIVGGFVAVVIALLAFIALASTRRGRTSAGKSSRGES